MSPSQGKMQVYRTIENCQMMKLYGATGAGSVAPQALLVHLGVPFELHLIDFDKGRIRYLGESWKASNLARLQRSLLKFKSLNP